MSTYNISHIFIIIFYRQVKVNQDSVVDATGERVSMISTDVLMGVDEVIKNKWFSFHGQRYSNSTNLVSLVHVVTSGTHTLHAGNFHSVLFHDN